MNIPGKKREDWQRGLRPLPSQRRWCNCLRQQHLDAHFAERLPTMRSDSRQSAGLVAAPKPSKHQPENHHSQSAGQVTTPCCQCLRLHENMVTSMNRTRWRRAACDPSSASNGTARSAALVGQAGQTRRHGPHGCQNCLQHHCRCQCQPRRRRLRGTWRRRFAGGGLRQPRASSRRSKAVAKWNCSPCCWPRCLVDALR